MKVLHIIHSMDPSTGGVASTLRNLLPELQGMGMHTEIACFDKPAAEGMPSDETYIIHRLGPSIGKWGRVRGFKKWLDQHAASFNLIVLHGLWLYNSYAYTKWIRQRRRSADLLCPKTWVMPHGMLDPWFQKFRGRRLKSIRNLIYWCLFERHTIAAADLLIFTSAQECHKAAITFPMYTPHRTAVLSLGVPDPPAAMDTMAWEMPISSSNGYMLALGRIDPKKGFYLLPEVWKRLLQDERYRHRLPDLVIAGPGWETRHGRQIKARIDALELGRHIKCMGMLQGPAKWNTLRSCKAVVMPSHQENFGLVATEALACGTPVLLSDQVDIHEVIVQAGGGLAGADTADGMERMIKNWIDMSPEACETMRASARMLYQKNFRIDIMADRFVAMQQEQ